MPENSINFISQQGLTYKRSFVKRLVLKTQLSIIFLVAVVVAGLGAYGLKTFFDSQANTTQTETEKLEAKRSISAEDAILQMPNQVRRSEELFKKHFYATSILKFFRENTLKQVQIMTATFDRESRLLTFSAQANTFDTLVAQLLFLRSESELSDVKISGIKLLETGGVSFQINLALAESVITTP